MIIIRKAQERGHADHGWLNTWHTFSFADYYDPEQMGYSSLRVINDDRVAGGGGFPTHPHRDMEIVTYVLSGALEHKDSMGNGTVIRPGEVQRMSAGTGIRHSEFNASPSEEVHLLQIWIMPDRSGLTPSYEQKFFDDAKKLGKLRLVASPDGSDGSVTIHQDAKLYASLIDPGHPAEHALLPGRRAYLHVARGSASLNGEVLEAGDGARIESESKIRLESNSSAEILLFDLA
ncbi:quercetin 2,3-dioxygenase [Sulfuricella sp. T08]|uniref:pirin family protein n=1 Tax=Sulfuricella sp. T08 TaxID=1632857 RepID=UPI0006179D98|nr:pirin family protein [Sulfuricella sp. T08]GAO37347.1 quercetin 2,3-dioxygenase [Sulfuricella sp. T08]